MPDEFRKRERTYSVNEELGEVAGTSTYGRGRGDKGEGRRGRGSHGRGTSQVRKANEKRVATRSHECSLLVSTSCTVEDIAKQDVPLKMRAMKGFSDPLCEKGV